MRSRVVTGVVTLCIAGAVSLAGAQPSKPWRVIDSFEVVMRRS